MERLELDRNGIPEESLEAIRAMVEKSGKKDLLGSLDHNEDFWGAAVRGVSPSFSFGCLFGELFFGGKVVRIKTHSISPFETTISLR